VERTSAGFTPCATAPKKFGRGAAAKNFLARRRQKMLKVLGMKERWLLTIME